MLTYHGNENNGARGSYKVNILNPYAETPTAESEASTTEYNPSTPAEPNPPEEVVLDPFGRFTLSWTINEAAELITFNLAVETQGYVGFGISKSGTMAGSDIVVATIEDGGEINLKVMSNL